MLGMGRPSDYTPHVASLICERLADGESLRTICRDEDMPSRTSVWRWLAAEEAFRYQYARAREAQLDALADEIVQIADESRRGVKTTTKADGTVETTEGDMVDRARLQVDARKWVLSKLKPGTYGDKLDLEHRASVQMAITTIERVIVDPKG